MESVIFTNAIYLLPLLMAMLIWLWSIKIKSKILPVISYLIAIAVMVFGALDGAGYQELIIIALAFALCGIITYDGEKEAEK